MCAACNVYHHKWAYGKVVNGNGNRNWKYMVVSDHWTGLLDYHFHFSVGHKLNSQLHVTFDFY